MNNREEIQNLIPKYVIDLAETLQKKGYESYLVGGSVRDLLLGKVPADYDIATNAYPEEIEKIFPKSIPTGAKFGTMTVVVDSESGERFDLEVTTYRSEEDYFGGRWPAKVEYAKTIEEDLSRRDFTINSMALDLQNFDTNMPIEALLKDPFEGLKDLNLKVIRAVRDPMERFLEDGLRPVRACRLAAQLEFRIEPMTFKAIKETNHITSKVSVERFREELVKLLMKSSKPSVGLRLMKESGILEIFIPELVEGVGVTQPEFHTEDVFEHSIHTCDLAEDSIKLAALFHDIGKPRTMTRDDKGTHFYGHDVVGAEMTKEIMKRLKFPNYEIRRTSTLVRWHMIYYPSADWRGNITDENDIDRKAKGLTEHDIEVKLQSENGTKAQGGWSDSAVRRLIARVGGQDEFDDLMKLRIADATANPKSPFNPKEIDALADRVAKVRSQDMALKLSDLDITGKDLMQELNIEAGKSIGEILDYLLEQVLEDPKLNSRDQLLKLSNKYLEENK